MGQYYRPIILREKNGRFRSQGFYAHMYHNGLKLTEHSYCGNGFTETVVGELYDKPGRLAWIGDYAKKGDLLKLNAEAAVFEQAFFRHYKKFHCDIDWTKDMDDDSRFFDYNYDFPEEIRVRRGRFILNHDKKVYIDLEEYEENNPPCQEGEDWHFHPLPLLTAIGNGRGSGDFAGIGEGDVGSWAGDLIETKDARLDGYKDVTPRIRFQERYFRY